MKRITILLVMLSLLIACKQEVIPEPIPSAPGETREEPGGDVKTPAPEAADVKTAAAPEVKAPPPDVKPEVAAPEVVPAGPCKPSCENRTCGGDGCRGSCGACMPPDKCEGGRCSRRIAVCFLAGDKGSLDDARIPAAVVSHMLPFPANWTGECAYGQFPTELARAALVRNPQAALMLNLNPECGLADFQSKAFTEDGPAYKAAVALGKAIAAHPAPVFVRFAPDMNTPWYAWGHCIGRKKGETCVKDPANYRTAFANLARVLKEHGGDRLLMAWTPHVEEDYWHVDYKGFPRYQDCYPGDEAVDWVGISVVYTEPNVPVAGDLSSRMEPFYTAFAAEKNKPMMIAETGVECGATSTWSLIQPLDPLEDYKGWWGPWGKLQISSVEGAAPKPAKDYDTGLRHLTLAVAPDVVDDRGRPACPKVYVGGASNPLGWEHGLDVSWADGLVFYAKRDKNGRDPRFQIDVCDHSSPNCPKDDECCDKESFFASVLVTSKTWERYIIPFEKFQPAKPAMNPTLEWDKVRSLSFHLLCDEGKGPLAMLHLDGLGLAEHKLERDKKCDERGAAWARQVFTKRQCYEFPALKLILWNQTITPRGKELIDTRLQDEILMKTLLTNPCYTRVF